MQLANNPLLALFSSGGTVTNGTFSFEGQGQIEFTAGADAFAALVANKPVLTTSETAGQADVVKALATLLPKLEGIFRKLETVLGTASAEIELPAELPLTLQELGAVLAEVNDATNGNLFEALKEGLVLAAPSGETAEPSEQAGVLQMTDLIGQGDAPISELFASVIEVLNVLRPVVQQAVQDVVQSLGVQVQTASLPASAPQLAVLQELFAKRPNPTLQQTAAAPDAPAQIVAETARIVQSLMSPQASNAVDTPDGLVLPLIRPFEQNDTLLTQLRDLGPNAQNVLRAFMSEQNNTAQSSVFKEILSQMTPVTDAVAEVPTIIAPEAAPVSAASDTQINAVQQTQNLRGTEAANPRFVNAVLSQMRAVDIQEGVTKVELTPRGLGSIEIEMKTNSDGSLSVVVRAENAHVLNSLREERDLLAQIIGQSGEGSVDFQDYDSDTQQGQGDSDGFGTVGETAGEGSESVTEALEREATIGGGALDMTT